MALKHNEIDVDVQFKFYLQLLSKESWTFTLNSCKMIKVGGLV